MQVADKFPNKGDAAYQYSEALHKSFLFYYQQRSGRLPHQVRPASFKVLTIPRGGTEKDCIGQGACRKLGFCYRSGTALPAVQPLQNTAAACEELHAVDALTLCDYQCSCSTTSDAAI